MVGTFLGGTIAIASFCGMDICEDLLSPLSLFMDMRNCSVQYVSQGCFSLSDDGGMWSRQTYLDHGCGAWSERSFATPLIMFIGVKMSKRWD
jgi:hypothetical protein